MGSRWFMIHTREQLIHEIQEILRNHYHDGSSVCAEEIADLISTLNDNDDKWKNVP